MSKLPVINMQGERTGEADLADELLAFDKGDAAVHQAVVAFRDRQRAGTAHTLGKGAVAGSGKKPYKQKGTGRARAGYLRSPVRVGGGVAHGPHPRDYVWSLPKKMARLAFRRALTLRIQEGAVQVIEPFELLAPKTKLLAALRTRLGARKLCLVVDRVDETLERAARNLASVAAVTAAGVNVYDLLNHPRVLVTRAGLAALTERLQAPIRRGA